MTEFEATRGMPADSTIVFDTAANLPEADHWLPAGLHLHTRGPGVVQVEGEQAAGHQGHQGLVRADRDRLRLEWGSRDHPGYAGWLQIADGAGGTSRATLHLRVDDPSAPDEADLRKLVETSLDKLAEQVGDRLQSG
jgi:hypothetical protein